MKVVWTEQAWRRLVEIEEFIGRDDPRAASRLVDRLIERGEALSDHANRGRKLPELPESGLRELVVGSYRLVYRRSVRTIEVLTVFEAVGRRLTQYSSSTQRRPAISSALRRSHFSGEPARRANTRSSSRRIFSSPAT